jgi:hypothetical protein
MKFRRLVLPLASAALLAVGVYALRHRHIKQGLIRPPVFATASASVPALVRSLRPAYPFSVIPGGAYSQKELSIQAKRDPLVGRHYADFRMQTVRLVTLAEDRLEYVSYRKQGHIFWTRKQLRIPKGELILTDGVRMARARCGNRLSDAAPAAICAADEPTLDLSMPPMTPDLLRDKRITFAPPPELPYGDGVAWPLDDLLASAIPALPMPGTAFGESASPLPPNLLTFARGLPASPLVFSAPRVATGTVPSSPTLTPPTLTLPPPDAPQVSSIPEPGLFPWYGLWALAFVTYFAAKKISAWGKGQR